MDARHLFKGAPRRSAMMRLPPEAFCTLLQNQTKARRLTQDILAKHDYNKRFTDDVLYTLMYYHPDAETKFSKSIIGFEKRRNAYHGMTLIVIFEDGSEEDVAFSKKCIPNVFGRYNADKCRLDKLTKAMRNAINDTARKTYLDANTNEGLGRCVKCTKLTLQPCVDHFGIPFCQIMNSFMADEGHTVDTLKLESFDNWLYLQDDEVTCKWIEYHDARATYRILCNQCNSSCGTYGYKSKRN